MSPAFVAIERRLLVSHLTGEYEEKLEVQGKQILQMTEAMAMLKQKHDKYMLDFISCSVS
jgi:hypothetical protein